MSVAESAYDQWQRVLEREFFGPQMAGRAAVFYVNAEMERRLREAHAPLVALADAVSVELHWDRPTEMFGWLSMRCRDWAYGDQSQAPPSLPLLAVTVLAASRMASDGEISSSNYYTRLAEVFGAGEAGRDDLRAHFGPVVDMWQVLDSWLESRGGERGYSTISGDRHLTRIGYPISQALLREQDRRILTTFFAASDVTPGCPEDFPGPEITRRLRLWTSSHPRGLSSPLLKVLHGKGDGGEITDKREVLAKLLERLVEHWDGALYEDRQKPRPVSALRLVLARRGRELRWAAEAVQGVSATTVQRVESGERYELSSPYGGFYEGLRDIEVSAHQVMSGLVLEGDDLYLTWTPQPFIFFKEDEYDGNFVSVGAFSPGEPHQILVPNSALNSVRSVLENVADCGRIVERKAPLAGWTLIKNVDLDVEVSPANLLMGGTSHAEHFIPSTRHGIRFTGGLRIGSDLGRHHYLQGGIPDWLLPRDLAQGEVTLRVTLTDGEDQSHSHDFPLKKVLRPFPARRLPLSDGTYHLGTPDMGRETFTVSSALRERQAPDAGSVGHRCDVSAELEATRVGPEVRAIRGVKVPESLTVPRSLMVPRLVQQIILIGSEGELLPLDLPDIPDWIVKRLPGEVFGYAEVSIPEGYVWAIQRWQRRTTVKSLGDVGERTPDPDPEAGDTEWAEAVLSAASSGTGPLWDAYVTAAREVLK
ncbi:hypothetical protein ACWD62_21005 [Streptomyces sp. NPDC005146]